MIKFNFQRQEYKFLLNLNQYHQIRSYLTKRGLLPDTYSGKNQAKNYYIASLYLDTLNYQSYWEKLYGVYFREKYRLRVYNQKGNRNSPVFWEIKRKFGNWQKKERLCLPWNKTEAMLNHSLSLNQLLNGVSNQALLAKYYLTWLRKNLSPTILISYWREPFLDPGYPDFRLTFDCDIQAVATTDLFFPSRLRPILPDQVIMEIKFSGYYPPYLTDINEYFNLHHRALSKYCLSLEACGIVSEDESTFFTGR